jgi:DNA-binding CsgD family transcriptional regulator
MGHQRDQERHDVGPGLPACRVRGTEQLRGERGPAGQRGVTAKRVQQVELLVPSTVVLLGRWNWWPSSHGRRTGDAAPDELSREAEAGLLAPDAVHAVLTAAGEPLAGQPAGAGRVTGDRPAGLSERECEVLGLLARGLATKQVARRLGISPKTCDHHIQRLYGKAGVSTRAGATLFALEHGLVHPD